LLIALKFSSLLADLFVVLMSLGSGCTGCLWAFKKSQSCKSCIPACKWKNETC
jgi:hypothetical protein